MHTGVSKVVANNVHTGREDNRAGGSNRQLDDRMKKNGSAALDFGPEPRLAAPGGAASARVTKRRRIGFRNLAPRLANIT